MSLDSYEFALRDDILWICNLDKLLRVAERVLKKEISIMQYICPTLHKLLAYLYRMSSPPGKRQ